MRHSFLPKMPAYALALAMIPVAAVHAADDQPDFTKAFSITFRSDASAKAGQRLFQSNKFVEEAANFISEESQPYLAEYTSFYGYSIGSHSYADVYFRIDGTLGADGAFGYLDINSGSYSSAYGTYLEMYFSRMVAVSRVVAEICPEAEGGSWGVSTSQGAAESDQAYVAAPMPVSGVYSYCEIPFSTGVRENLYMKFPRHTSDGSTLNHCRLRRIIIVPEGAEWSGPENPVNPEEISLVFPDGALMSREFSSGSLYSFPLPAAADGRALASGGFSVAVTPPSGAAAPSVDITDGSFILGVSSEGLYGCTVSYDDGRLHGSAPVDVAIYPAMPELSIYGVVLQGDHLVIGCSVEQAGKASIDGVPQGCTLWTRVGESGPFREYSPSAGIDLLGANVLELYLSKGGADSPVRRFTYTLSSVVDAVDAVPADTVGCRWMTLTGLPVRDLARMPSGVYIRIDAAGHASLVRR